MVRFENGSLVCERFTLGPLEVNTYLLYERDGDKCLIIDPAEESQTLLERIKELEFVEREIFLTHGHADHIYGVEFFKSHCDAKVMISEADAGMLGDATLNLSAFLGDTLELEPAEMLIKDGDKFKLGSCIGEFRLIPGHTPGGMILVFDKMLFSGDTLFAGSVGRSDFPGGDGRELIESIKEKIFKLKNRMVFPGHGPETTIAEELQSNPFFGTFFNL